MNRVIDQRLGTLLAEALYRSMEASAAPPGSGYIYECFDLTLEFDHRRKLVRAWTTERIKKDLI